MSPCGHSPARRPPGVPPRSPGCGNPRLCPGRCGTCRRNSETCGDRTVGSGRSRALTRSHPAGAAPSSALGPTRTPVALRPSHLGRVKGTEVGRRGPRAGGGPAGGTDNPALPAAPGRRLSLACGTPVSFGKPRAVSSRECDWADWRLRSRPGKRGVELVPEVTWLTQSSTFQHRKQDGPALPRCQGATRRNTRRQRDGSSPGGQGARPVGPSLRGAAQTGVLSLNDAQLVGSLWPRGP